jgi:hypothetical protein
VVGRVAGRICDHDVGLGLGMLNVVDRLVGDLEGV